LRTDRYDGANSSFSQFCELVSNLALFLMGEVRVICNNILSLARIYIGLITYVITAKESNIQFATRRLRYVTLMTKLPDNTDRWVLN